MLRSEYRQEMGIDYMDDRLGQNRLTVYRETVELKSMFCGVGVGETD